MSLDLSDSSILDSVLSKPLSGRYRLGECEYESVEGTLYRDGESFRLEPKVAQLLEYLILRPEQIISKEQLLEDVWRGTPVVDEALHRCLSLLRKALNDDTRRPRYIETLAKRGYRFLVQAEKVSSFRPGFMPAERATISNSALAAPKLGLKVRWLLFGFLILLVTAWLSYWIWTSKQSDPVDNPYVQRAISLLGEDHPPADEILALLRRGIAFEPGNVFANSQLALLLGKHPISPSAAGFTELESAAKTAIYLSPDNQFAQLAYSVYLRRTQDITTADSFLMAAYKHRGQSPLFDLALADALYDAHAYALAQDLFWRRSSEPEWRDRSLRGLNTVYLTIGLEGKVVKTAQAVLEFAPLDDETASASARFLLSRARQDGLDLCASLNSLRCDLVKADSKLLVGDAEALQLYSNLISQDLDTFLKDEIGLRLAMLQGTAPPLLGSKETTAYGQWLAALKDAVQGKNNSALEKLEAARQLGWSAWWWDEVEPAFADIRHTHSFNEHIHSMRFDRSDSLREKFPVK